MERRPQLNRPYMVCLVVIAFLGLGFIAVGLRVRPFSDLTPEQNVWAQLVVDVLCLWAFLGLLNKMRNDSRVVIGDDHVSRPTLFGVKTLRWTEIREVRQVGYGIHLLGATTRIVLAPYAYADPHAVIAEISRRLRRFSS